MFVVASGDIENLGTLSPSGSIGVSDAIVNVIGVAPNNGANKLYTAARTTSNVGETGNLISTHLNNDGSSWASVLIGIEPKVTTTYINSDFVTSTFVGTSPSDFGNPVIDTDGLHVNSAITLGGALNTMLSGVAASIVIELFPVALTPPVNSVLKNGAVELLKVNGFGKISGGGIANADVGFGGFKGISRIGISYDATSVSICANGGTTQSLGTRPITSSTFVLQPGLIIRRIEIWASKLSATDLKLQTEVHNKQFAAMPTGSLYLPVALETFFDGFDSNTLRHRPVGTTSPIVPWPGNDTAFRQAIVDYYDKVGNWMPRLVHQSDAQGTGPSSINDEWEHYCDYDYPGNYNAFTFANSILTITARATSTLTSAQQAIIGNRYTGGGTVNTGVKYPIVSGMLNSAGKFAQKFGYFECRMKTTQISKAWPAFWLLPSGTWFNEVEFDVTEQIGITGDPGYDSAAVHWNSNANTTFRDIHNTYDMSADFHTYGMLWQPGLVEYYRDGVILFSIPTTGNTDNYACYMLLNLAVGGNFPGDPDSATYAGLPTTIQVDYIRVFSAGFSGPVIISSVGTARGLAGVGGVGAIKAIFNSQGSASGVSSVSAISSFNFVFSSVGSAAGISSVSAVSSTGSFISSAQGAASGAGGATGVGRNLYTLSSKGTASGLASAAATSSQGGVTIVARAGAASGKVSVSGIGANAQADPFAPVNFVGTGTDTGFTFKHVAPHPFSGRMTRYFNENGRIKLLLGYTNTFSLWFANRNPIVTKSLNSDGVTYSSSFWYDFGRLCAAEQAGPISRGERLVIGIPADHNALQYYPNLPDGSGDPRNLPMYTMREMAQGPNGAATSFYNNLRIGMARIGQAGVTNPIIRIMWEHTGGWFRDAAKAGEGGYWIMVFNHIIEQIQTQIPGAIACWNMASDVGFQLASMKDTVWVSTTDANTINNDGVTITVAGAMGVGKPANTPMVAGTAIKAGVMGIDNYNSCWPDNTKVYNNFTQSQIDSTLLLRWNTQGGKCLNEANGYAVQLGLKFCFPEWGTGYDSSEGVPVDSNGAALWFNGHAGGDDYVYINKMYDFCIALRKVDRLFFFNYWERSASDGFTALSFASNVVYRTNLTHNPPTLHPYDPYERVLAAKAFVQTFGIPLPQG